MSKLAEFFAQLNEPFTGEELFDHMHDIVFFIKDRWGAYLVVNETLVERAGRRSKDQLIGRTAAEVLAPLGDAFAEQDRILLKSGAPLYGQLELHVHASGKIGWCKTTKLPLRNQTDEVIGLVGVSQDLQVPDLQSENYSRVSRTVRYVMENLDCRITVQGLADLAGLSRFQLDHRILKAFGVKTSAWLQKVRIDAARNLLADSSESISSIAVAVGYFDQSAFSRQFRKSTGMTPRDYRMTQVNAKNAANHEQDE